jgi:hypothetical protein
MHKNAFFVDFPVFCLHAKQHRKNSLHVDSNLLGEFSCTKARSWAPEEIDDPGARPEVLAEKLESWEIVLAF